MAPSAVEVLEDGGDEDALKLEGGSNSVTPNKDRRGGLDDD